MYTQTLCSIVPSQPDYASVKSKFPGLKDTNVNGTLTGQIQRMLDNIDTLSGPGSSKTLLDGFGVKAGDIANLDPDTRTKLSEKVTNRYMSAIKEAAGDTMGSFADVYGNLTGDAATEASPNGTTTATASGSIGSFMGPQPDQTGTATAASAVDPAGTLADILMRSVAYRIPATNAAHEATTEDPKVATAAPATPAV
ncbi:hypothetical protein [Luteibacter aegosomatissinici]|uniref:hypothetical protein n=1 Tax=Luteibacter aegosomatissinici TaxID=2911539 RepID=UPI001FF78CDE|nr:hypothetical protein [Luteibacter aegosomatissinici]UPG92854.1 hypothetical protein L2Y97_13365 [Luteibacter aegosomatissinici]